MNAPFDPTLLMNEKFAVGQPVSRKEDPVLLRGEGRYTDDLNRPASFTASWCAAGWRTASYARSTPTARARCRRASDHHGGRPRCGRHQEHAGRCGKAPRRHADAASAAAAARDRSRALCRRTDRHGGGGDDQAGEGRGRVDLRRYRSAARGHDRQRRGGAGCAAAARRCAGQRLPGLSLTATARRSLPPSRVPRMSRHCRCATTASSCLPDGTALRHRRIRSGRGSADPASRLPGRVRPAQSAERHPRRAGGEAARSDRQCRRLVRHEGVRLSGIYLPAVCRAHARPPGEMDR